MLMRSEGGSNVDCEEPTIALACLDPELDSYKDCPAACREGANKDEDGNVIKSGSLDVSSSAADDRSVVVASATVPDPAPANMAEWRAAQPGAVSDLDTLTFKTSEDVTIQKVVLEKYGYSTADDLVKSVWLEDEDGKEVSNKAKPNSKGLVNLTIKKDYKVVDWTFNATVVVETLVNSKVGGTLGFKVVDVNSTAKDVDLGNYKAYTYDVVAYDGTTAKVTAKWGEKDYNYEGNAVEISKFKIKAPDDSSIVVNSFTLTNLDTSNKALDIYDNIDSADVEVSIDGKAVKANVSINKDEEMTISLKDSLELAAKEQVQIVVSAKFNSDFEDYGSTIILGMAKSSDISATDKNNARITIDLSGATGKWIKYTINGWQVKLTNTKLGNVEAALNSTDILIAEWYITIWEDLEDGKLVVNVDGTNPDAIEAMRLVIAGDEYDGEHDSTYTTWTFSNIEISESGKIRLYVDTNSDTSDANVAKFGGKSYTLTFADGANDGWDSFHYVNGVKGANADPSGSITISKLTIQTPEGTLVNNLSSSDDVEFPNKELNTEVVFEGTYKADKQNVYLNTFKLTRTAAYDQPSKIRFYLYVDDMETSVADVTVNNGTATWWSDDFNDILVKAGETVKVKVEAEVDAKQEESSTGLVLNGTIGKFKVILEGTDENDNDAWTASRNTSSIVIVKKWSASVEENSVARNVVLRKASTSKIAQFVVKPDSANKVTLEEISFNLTFTKATGAEDYDWNVDLYVDGSNKNLKGPAEGYNGAYKAEFNTEVNSEGVVVTVELDDEFDGEVKLTALNVNGNPVTNKEFNKKFVDAVVWFASQSSDDDNTTFKFGIDKKGSAIVDNVVLTLKNGTGTVSMPINNGDEIKAGTPYDVVNQASQMDVIGISYDVDDVAVTISNNPYSDMFKIGMKDDGTQVRVARLKN